MKVRAVLLAAVAPLLAGCTIEQKVSVQPLRTRTIETTATKDDAFTAAVQAVMSSGWSLGGSDRAVGFVQTEWRDTVQDDGFLPVCYGFAVDRRRSRRLSFAIAVDESRLTITPRTEICKGRVCSGTDKISGPELAMMDVLEGNISRALAGKAQVVVEPGMTVLIEKTNGAFYRGVVVSALPSKVVLRFDGAEHEISTAEIRSVKVFVPK